MNFMKNMATAMVMLLKIGLRRRGKFEKMKHINNHGGAYE